MKLEIPNPCDQRGLAFGFYFGRDDCMSSIPCVQRSGACQKKWIKVKKRNFIFGWKVLFPGHLETIILTKVKNV